MSIPVEVGELAAAAAEQAPFCYLLTVRPDARTHVVAVTPRIARGVVECEAGRTACANASERADVVLLWPPARADDFSLIVDGRASVDGSRVTITPARAVKHRPAPS